MRQHVPIVLEFWPYGMGRANSFPALKQTLLKYDNFFDLSEDAPVKTPLTESALDILHKKFDGTINFTDILVV